MTQRLVIHHSDAGVCRIMLSRPEVRNAFDDALIAELHQAFSNASQDASIRVVVLAAEGAAFCAGADLNWMRAMADYTFDENVKDAGGLAGMLHALYSCTKPTIARVQGDVYAGGMGLVSACDVAVSVDSAHFCLSEVKLGLIPATISPYVVRAMGARAAHRYALTAERFTAQEAHRLGLVHEVVGAERLDAQVADWVQSLLSASPQAVARCKRLLHEVAHESITPELIHMTTVAIAESRASDDGKDGVQAFLNKRKPHWLG
jgi:methylglutaconyl-CoA hydratase